MNENIKKAAEKGERKCGLEGEKERQQCKPLP